MKKRSENLHILKRAFGVGPNLPCFLIAPKLEKTITEGDIENNLARPIMIVATDAATESVDVLPTPAKPLDWNKKERVLYKSKIKWLDSSVNINEATTDATKDTIDVNGTSNEDIAEDRTIDIELPEKSDYNLDYTDAIGKEVAKELEIMNYSYEESNDSDEEMLDNIRVLFLPPSSPSLSHIPIYLELPTAECPVFCIQVNVEIRRMAKQVKTRCRSSALCNNSKSNRKRR